MVQQEHDLSEEDLSAIVGCIHGIIGFMDTEDGLLSLLRSQPVEVVHRAVINQVAVSSNGSVSFSALFSSVQQVGRAAGFVDGRFPIAIATDHQFNAVANVPDPGTRFDCRLQDRDVIVAHAPGLPLQIFGTSPGRLQMNRYIVRVLQDPLYSISGFWGEDYSVHRGQGPRGQRFLVTLVCYVSSEAPEENSSFPDFDQRFHLGERASKIMPWV